MRALPHRGVAAAVDTDEHVWTVPATRTKAKREYRVPLCRHAEQILGAARTLGGGNPLVIRADHEPPKRVTEGLTLLAVEENDGSSGGEST